MFLVRGRDLLEYALEGEDVRDHLAFPCVFGTITGEEIRASGNGRVIEVTFQGASFMSVDDSEGGWVGD